MVAAVGETGILAVACGGDGSPQPTEGGIAVTVPEQDVRARRPVRRTASAAVLAVALASTGCAGSGGGGASNLATATTASGVGAEPAAPTAEPAVMRLALAPDPIWQWLEDSGTRAAWERDRNVRFEVSHPFDQFAAFVGGHADVVLINVLDVPQFVEQAERVPVIIGKYTTDRSLLAVRRTSRAENLDDLVERRIAVESSLGSTLLWGLIADLRYGLEFRPGGGDFDLVVVDAAGIADLAMRGDVDACICTPDVSVPLLSSGRLRALYDGRSAAEIVTEYILATVYGGAGSAADVGTIADVFMTDKAWHDANDEAVDALLGMWEEGLAAWQEHKSQIVADYPHHFSVETDAEIAWLTDYVEAHDWIVPSVYITDQETETHNYAFSRLRDLGLVPADALRPEIDAVRGPGADDAHSGNDDTHAGAEGVRRRGEE
ncbi:MAG: hypothetical protein OXG91_00520 [bacterium]|nr:hypothetical protein [bacterium]